MLLRYFLKGLLLPPASGLLLIAAGVLLRRRWPRLGPLLALSGFLSLWLLSLPWTAQALLERLETVPPLLPATLDTTRADAIVVLSAGRYLGAPEYGAPRPDGLSLQRIEYAAFLARQTGLPVIVSGGAVFGDGLSAAELMAASLRDDFGIADVTAETVSQTTWDNAIRTRALFAADARPRVLLVTHAWHMPRSVWSFEANGFEVVAAPTRFADSDHHDTGALRFMPSAQALVGSSMVVHEYLGLAAYGVLYRR
jgi:uncharacterized SAM-binding protein YcdF (DUF218 family)